MLPPPPVPVDADLTGLPGMMIDVRRLLSSTLALTQPPDVFRVAVLSWTIAWHQIPAGSMPNDDAVLARWFGFHSRGHMAQFRRAGKLRGWVLHSDGRLYHPVVTENVLAILAMRKKDRNAFRKGQQPALAHPESSPTTPPNRPPRLSGVVPHDSGESSPTTRTPLGIQPFEIGQNASLTEVREEEERETALLKEKEAARKAFDALFGGGVEARVEGGGDVEVEQPRRRARPYMPSLGDPEPRWSHFATSTAIDPKSMNGASVHYRGSWQIRLIALMVAREVGWYASTIRPDWTPLLRWLDDGLDPHDHILPTIRRVMARQSEPNAIASLAYFDRAVREAAGGKRRAG